MIRGGDGGDALVPRTHKIVVIRFFQNLTCFIVFGDGCQIYYKTVKTPVASATRQGKFSLENFP